MTVYYIVAIGILGLCWGSFINVLGPRILHGRSLLTKRSMCPSCGHIIAWYDNIPLLSYFLLKARCRSCRQPISWLYPFTEVITAACAMVLATMVSDPFVYFCYALFLTGLIAATRTDLELMLIPVVSSLGLVPVGFVAAWADLLAISLTESLVGAIAGYAVLWLVAKGFAACTKREGLGVGDMDLLAGIGAWLGPVGIWLTLLIASCSGALVGGVYLYAAGKERHMRLPFGPFLALGAAGYLFFGSYLLSLFFFP